MNVIVDRYCICHRCSGKVMLDKKSKLNISYYGEVGGEYRGEMGRVFCESCSFSFIKWLNGGNVNEN